MTANEESILLVEDNGDDVLLVRRAFKKCGIGNPIHLVSNGESAIQYLAGENDYADRTRHPLPLIVLLDLKLPKRSGLEVLQWMRQEALLKRIPVIILTSSNETSDINKAYDAGANSYLVKPVIFQDLQRLVERLEIYWLRTNKAPDLSTG